MQGYILDTNLSHYPFLLLGDLSGIQEFIFNVKSEGAAKTLKGRSFYVQALSDLCLDLIEERLGGDNCLLFYNGGGNFYVFCKSLDDAQLKELRRLVQQELADSEIYLSLSVTSVQTDSFSSIWDAVHRQAGRDKLRKFGQAPGAFEPSERPEGTQDWKRFVKNLTRAKGFSITDHPAKPGIHPKNFGRFGFTLELKDSVPAENKPDRDFVDSIRNKLPIWTGPLLAAHPQYVARLNARNLAADPPQDPTEDGDILEFETLGYFAGLRTGTDKIGVLKMDVDNLGALFRQTDDPAKTKRISDALKEFFDQELYRLWTESFEFLDREGTPGTARFNENIYVVFAGGDDCLMIGGWDAIFAFAGKVRSAFDTFLTSQDLGLNPLPTLSASITILDSKFPVVRMGELAENALHEAKTAHELKNRISVFGRVLTWSEFERARNLAEELDRLIKQHDEPRGILHRVQASHVGFERLQQRALEEGLVFNPSIWRLFYFIRNSKNLERLQGVMQQYERALLDAILAKIYTNAAALFPVAARWAELLTR